MSDAHSGQLRVLIVEDDNDVVRELKDCISENLQNIQCNNCNFSHAKGYIKEYRPHALVVDLFEGNIDAGQNPGQKIAQFVQDNIFRPVIVYSAHPEGHDASHPLLKNITKGSGTESEIIDALNEYKPFMEAIYEAEKSVDDSFTETMKEIVPYVSESTQRNLNMLAEVISRTHRRRIAARMDFGLDSSSLEPWEIYLYPPVSNQPMLGDLLKKTDSNSKRSKDGLSKSTNQTDFSVILTPSCDLVPRGTENQPRAKNVLVAHCFGVERLLENNAFEKMKTLKSKLSGQLLSQPHYKGLLALPKCSNEIPNMVVDLYNLSLIPFNEIGPNGPYERIASIDSPFREMIAWAYAEIAGRPGVPDRNFKSWQRDILEDLDKSSDN